MSRQRAEVAGQVELTVTGEEPVVQRGLDQVRPRPPAGASSSWTARTRSAGRARRSSGVVPVRAQCQVSTFRPPLGRSAPRTTSQAVARSGTRDQASHSRWTSRPCSRGAVAQGGEGLGALVDGPRPAQDLGRVERAGPDRFGDAQEVVLAVGGRRRAGRRRSGSADAGGARRPPPGRVDLGHDEAVVVEHGAHLGVAVAVVSGPGVVAPPQRDGVVAGVGGRRRAVRETTTSRGDRARAQDEGVRSECQGLPYRSAEVGLEGGQGVREAAVGDVVVLAAGGVVEREDAREGHVVGWRSSWRTG